VKLTAQQLRIIATWHEAGSIREAAFLLGIGEQTVKNTLLTLRRRVGVESNEDLVAAHWKDLPAAFSDDPVKRRRLYRRLRYRYDEGFRNRQRTWSADYNRRARSAARAA